MRGILLRGFFRCRALSSGPNIWARKRRRSFPLPQVKRQKPLAAVVSQQASTGDEEDGSGEDDDLLDEDVQSKESAGGSEELSEFLVTHNRDVDVPIAPQGRQKLNLFPCVSFFTA